MRFAAWRAALISATAGLGAVAVINLDASRHTEAFVVLGAMLTVIAGLTIPFKTLCPTLVLVSIFTHITIPVSGFHMRPDMALMPATFISCATSGYLPTFARWCRHGIVRLLACFVALNYFSSLFFSDELKKSLTISTWYLIDLVILLLALAYYSERRDALESNLMTGAWITIVVGIAAWLIDGHRHIPGASTVAGEGLRAYGVSFEPNILAGTAAIWLVIILGRGKRLSRSERLFCLLALIVIPLTATRAALLAIAVGGLISCFAIGRGTRIAKRLIVSIGAFAVVLFVVDSVVPSLGRPLVQKLIHINFGNSSGANRFLTWHQAIGDLHGISWVFGLGTNTFGTRHIDPTSIYNIVPGATYLSNLPLDILYDVGVVGAVVMGIVSLRLVARGKTTGKRVRRLAILATFIALATSTNPFFFSYFWLFIALATLSRETAVPLQLGARRPFTVAARGNGAPASR